MSACTTSVSKLNGSQSVIIRDQTKAQIVENLKVIISNYNYYLYSDSENEVVFETHPNRQNLISYAQYDKSYYQNYYSGYRNRLISPPHYQIVFQFTPVKNGYLIESAVNFKAFRHLDDQNVNSSTGVTVQKILNELKDNSQMDILETRYRDYNSIHHLLKYKISTQEITGFKKKNYIRKVVLSISDFNRQVKAMIFTKQQLKNYCNYNGGIFEEANDSILYSSTDIKIPDVFYNSFNRANNLKAFGIKTCVSEEGVMWRLVIKPKIFKPEKKSKDKKINRELTKFDNPEMFLYIYMLEKNSPKYKRKSRNRG